MQICITRHTRWSWDKRCNIFVYQPQIKIDYQTRILEHIIQSILMVKNKVKMLLGHCQVLLCSQQPAWQGGSQLSQVGLPFVGFVVVPGFGSGYVFSLFSTHISPFITSPSVLCCYFRSVIEKHYKILPDPDTSEKSTAYARQ